MLEKDEIQRILEAVQPIEVLKIDGKFFDYAEVNQFISNHGYSKEELEKIDKEGHDFDEDDYENHLNDKEGDFEICGYSYDAGSVFRSYDSSDFGDAYLEYCNDNLYEFNSHGKDTYYTLEELVRVTKKSPLFSYSIEKRLADHHVLANPVPPSSPDLKSHTGWKISSANINGGINE